MKHISVQCCVRRKISTGTVRPSFSLLSLSYVLKTIPTESPLLQESKNIRLLGIMSNILRAQEAAGHITRGTVWLITDSCPHPQQAMLSGMELRVRKVY